MVPKGWESKLLVNLIAGQIKNGYSPNPTDIVTGYWVLGLGSLGDHGINISGIKAVEPSPKVLQSQLEAGDFLISRSNTPDKVGRTIRFKGEISNCSYPDLMMRFRIDTNKADPDFIELKLKSNEVRDYYSSCAAGSSSTMVKINKSVVEKTPILLPSIGEQKKIAKILSVWNKAIITTEQLLTNSQQQKKALMQRLLTGKVRFSESKKSWKKIQLKKLLTEGKERNKSKSVTCVLSVTNHSGFVLPENQFSKRVASEDVSNYKIVRKGQFGYNPSRINVGSFARLDKYDEGILSPMYVIFSVDESMLNSDYFLHWMSSDDARLRIAASTQGSVRESVGFDALCAINFLLPSLSEQQKISALLNSSNNEIDILKKRIVFLKQEKKALMQQLLTGKRRVIIN